MKKTLLAALIALLATATTATAQKFGYCNSLAILAEMPEMKQADSDLAAFQTQLQKKGQEMVRLFQEKAQELQRKQEQGLISPKDYADQEAALQKEQEDINLYAQKVDADLAKKRDDLYKPILDKVNTAMKDVATEGNYFMVFDLSSQVLLYADPTLDVTETVMKKLGITPPPKQ